MFARRLLVLGGIGLALLVAAQTLFVRPTAAAGLFTRVSAGTQSQGGGTYASLSADGRFVAFESAAPDLVPGQVNDSWDTLVRDRASKQIERVSITNTGAAAYNVGDYTSAPSISPDGSQVAFVSRATGLTQNSTNALPNVYLRNRTTNSTILVSVSTKNKSGNDASFTPALSANGRFVAFQSFATDLTAGDSNGSLDVFVRDLQSGVTELVSVNDAGQQGSDFHDYGYPGLAISADGRYVAFSYQNLPVSRPSDSTEPGIFLRDRTNHTTRFIAYGTLPAFSADMRYLAFVTSQALVAADTNNAADVYLADLQNPGTFERVSVSSSGDQGGDASIQSAPALSANGRYVVFATNASLDAKDTNYLTDIYLRDRQTNTTLLVTQTLDGAANGESSNPAISGDGSIIAFNSLASNLVSDDTNNSGDVFIYDHTQFGAIGGGTHLLFVPAVFH